MYLEVNPWPLRWRKIKQECSRGEMLHREYLQPAKFSETRQKLSTTDLAFRIFAAFRAHPHINNVLTHIAQERAYLQSLIREDFERCHPSETPEDVKRRASF